MIRPFENQRALAHKRPQGDQEGGGAGLPSDFQKYFLSVFWLPLHKCTSVKDFLYPTFPIANLKNAPNPSNKIPAEVHAQVSLLVLTILVKSYFRFGQEKPVYIYRFLAKGTMEEKIYDRQVRTIRLPIPECQIQPWWLRG